MDSTSKLTLLSALFAVAIAGCSDSGSSSSSSSAGTTSPKASFPSFYQLTKEVLPSTTTTASATSSRNTAGTHQRAAALSTFSASAAYSSDAVEFNDAFSVDQNYIGQVFNDAGQSGPVKSMFVLLAQADETMTTINEQLLNSTGEPVNCTSIATDTTLVTPFFAAAANAAFNEWDDANKYTCYVSEENEILVFGRHAITSSETSCTDPFEYYVMRGSSVDDAANDEQVEVRGGSKDLAAISKFYYNGCSKDLKLAFAHTTLYSAGVEFSSRSEITGNVESHEFAVRSNYIDADTSYAQHVTITGTGTSKLADASAEGPAHFIMSYRADNCGNSTDSTSCTAGSTKTFCVRNSGTSNAYELETDASQCAELSTNFSLLVPLERSDIPMGYFDTSPTALGL